jgi:SAM-dependent methyltransferase
MKKLNIGCGNDIKKGYVNVDIRNLPGVNVVWDITKTPYPFEENSVDLIEMHHVLEHLENPLKVLEEFWRICKPGAKIIISVPHWSHFTAYGDLTHKKYYSSAIFMYYETGDSKYYSEKANFKVVKKKFTATRINQLWVNKLVNPIINISPILTEMIFSKFLPVSQIIFVLKVIK